MGAEIHLWWKDRRACRSLRTGVSLHSHTLHSREYLTFVPCYLKAIPLLAWLVRREARRHGIREIPHSEFARTWWTPPLSAHAAWSLEKSNIENRLQRRALVSITDHDNVEAADDLLPRGECRPTLMSIEWTVPFCGVSFHIGVHNLPHRRARSLVRSNRPPGAGGSAARARQRRRRHQIPVDARRGAQDSPAPGCRNARRGHRGRSGAPRPGTEARRGRGPGDLRRLRTGDSSYASGDRAPARAYLPCRRRGLRPGLRPRRLRTKPRAGIPWRCSVTISGSASSAPARRFSAPESG